ncbi:MAG TPA: DoxX family membrane protein [Acetobacteraceae bacterium]|nr:DoxX family membrane protein [Acetobacteraceae bacterium]
MNGVMMDRRFVLAFRLLMGWTFLYAGAWQVLSSDFSAATFLAHTKTFHDIYAPLTSPTIAPVLTFLVSWGHLLIGLSLVSGLLVRGSGVLDGTASPSGVDRGAGCSWRGGVSF